MDAIHSSSYGNLTTQIYLWILEELIIIKFQIRIISLPRPMKRKFISFDQPDDLFYLFLLRISFLFVIFFLPLFYMKVFSVTI